MALGLLAWLIGDHSLSPHPPLPSNPQEHANTPHPAHTHLEDAPVPQRALGAHLAVHALQGRQAVDLVLVDHLCVCACVCTLWHLVVVVRCCWWRWRVDLGMLEYGDRGGLPAGLPAPRFQKHQPTNNSTNHHNQTTKINTTLSANSSAPFKLPIRRQLKTLANCPSPSFSPNAQSPTLLVSWLVHGVNPRE
jgi:hypothetical protein